MNGKKWICTICGYAYEGETAPERCPLCRASQAWGSAQETWQEPDVVPQPSEPDTCPAVEPSTRLEEPTDTVPAEADAMSLAESVAKLFHHHAEKNEMVNCLDDEVEKWKNT